MHKKNITFILVLTLLLATYTRAFSEETTAQNNPKPASASVYNLGLKSYEQGDIESAITFFKQAIDLDPSFVDAYFNLGAIYKKQKKYYNAIEAFNKAVEMNPNDSEAAYELAGCYLLVEDFANAKNYFSMVSKDYEKYKEARQSLGTIEHKIALQNLNTNQNPNKDTIKSDEVQAELLVNKLEEITKEQPGEKAPERLNVVQQEQKESDSKNQAEAPVKARFKTVSSNFNGPAGITKDSKNNIYIANFTKDSIEKVTPDSRREIFIEKIGISGPVGLTVDENDNLYVANYTTGSIVKITQDKSVSVVVDKIVRPYYLFYDSATGNLYATVQGDDSLIEIPLKDVAAQPITSR